MLDVNPSAATASHSFHSFPSELHPAERFVGRHGGGREGSHNTLLSPRAALSSTNWPKPLSQAPL